MRYKIAYHSRLEFEEPISEQQGEMRLVPRTDAYQKTISHSLVLSPDVPIFEYRDAFGNQVYSFNAVPPHDSLEIRFEAEVENSLKNPFDFLPPTPAEEFAALKKLLREHPRYYDFVLGNGPIIPGRDRLTPGKDWPICDPKKNLLDSVQKAVEWIRATIRYETGSTEVHCPVETVLEKGSGVCQDFAHLLIAIVRDWGVPARYVMGYQYLDTGAGQASRNETHAWTEIYLPGGGWRGFDATHAMLANETYFPVAVGRDSRDAAPERSSFKGKVIGLKPQIQLTLSQQ